MEHFYIFLYLRMKISVFIFVINLQNLPFFIFINHMDKTQMLDTFNRTGIVTQMLNGKNVALVDLDKNPNILGAQTSEMAVLRPSVDVGGKGVESSIAVSNGADLGAMVTKLSIRFNENKSGAPVQVVIFDTHYMLVRSGVSINTYTDGYTCAGIDPNLGLLSALHGLNNATPKPSFADFPPFVINGVSFISDSASGSIGAAQSLRVWNVPANTAFSGVSVNYVNIFQSSPVENNNLTTRRYDALGAKFLVNGFAGLVMTIPDKEPSFVLELGVAGINQSAVIGRI